MNYRINKTAPTSQEKQKQRRILIKIMAVFLLVTVGLGYGFYYVFIGPPNDKYAYWKNLMAKDPKPEGVSEAEYREKNRAGYCWRDRKFYRPEELRQQAMESFVEKLLAQAEAFQANRTTNQGGRAETASACARSETDCRVWFLPQGYTNAQWDKLLLEMEDPISEEQLRAFGAKEIQSSADFRAYVAHQQAKPYSLNRRDYDAPNNLFGSDCCTVLPKEQVLPRVRPNELTTHLEDAEILPENRIPDKVDIRDYGVGNFYLEVRQLMTSSDSVKAQSVKPQKKETFQIEYPYIYFMNNCGDILWQPYYYDV